MGTQSLNQKIIPHRKKSAHAVQTSQHRVVIDGTDIILTVRRSRRRSLALQVDRHGPRVLAPTLLPLNEINRFIEQHLDWLKKRLTLLTEQVFAIRPLILHHGVTFPLLGKDAFLHLGTSGREAQWACSEHGVETLSIPHTSHPGQALLAAIHDRALAWYQDRVTYFCQCLGYPVPRVRLTNAQTRWGSCSRLSGIRLHWRLIHLAPTLIDYVVAHEVAHLAEMNHSPRFWAIVTRLYPDWRAARKRLRAAAPLLPVITP